MVGSLCIKGYDKYKFMKNAHSLDLRGHGLNCVYILTLLLLPSKLLNGSLLDCAECINTQPCQVRTLHHGTFRTSTISSGYQRSRSPWNNSLRNSFVVKFKIFVLLFEGSRIIKYLWPGKENEVRLNYDFNINHFNTIVRTQRTHVLQ